jgi:hypothetical protein
LCATNARSGPWRDTRRSPLRPPDIQARTPVVKPAGVLPFLASERSARCAGQNDNRLNQRQHGSDHRWQARAVRAEKKGHQPGAAIALKSIEPHAAKASTYFGRALAIARAQQTKSWELRAAMSLARLWRGQEESALRPMTCSRRSTAGSPKASTRWISRRQRRCWRSWYLLCEPP